MPAGEVLAKDRVIIEPRFSPDQRRQINDLPPAEVLAKDRFRALLEGAGVRIVRTPVQAPNANAYAERFVRSIREECLDRLILVGERRLLHVLKEFAAHYHEERNHQGLGNDLIAPAPRAGGRAGIRWRDRLGGLFRYYYQAA